MRPKVGQRGRRLARPRARLRVVAARPRRPRLLGPSRHDRGARGRRRLCAVGRPQPLSGSPRVSSAWCCRGTWPCIGGRTATAGLRCSSAWPTSCSGPCSSPWRRRSSCRPCWRAGGHRPGRRHLRPAHVGHRARVRRRADHAAAFSVDTHEPLVGLVSYADLRPRDHRWCRCAVRRGTRPAPASPRAARATSTRSCGKP